MKETRTYVDCQCGCPDHVARFDLIVHKGSKGQLTPHIEAGIHVDPNISFWGRLAAAWRLLLGKTKTKELFWSPSWATIILTDQSVHELSKLLTQYNLIKRLDTVRRRKSLKASPPSKPSSEEANVGTVNPAGDSSRS